MADIIETVAALLWLALGIVAWRRFRELNQRLSAVIDDWKRITEEAADD